ncbi:hypothetical protein [Halobacillus litoralis]|uniref:hypothetical protein n=1 Tax=Halobacillus litoralis TaxID=45668 RepID=UPI001CD4859B|nr:hypothetical protein [Halobacillus litoralis]MCA1021483.1 hypothetical protein [Halobacillus litoralis]
MLKDKTIQVFDTDSISKGDIISYKVGFYGDEGEIEYGKAANGVVDSIEEDSVTLITLEGTLKISLDNLEHGDYTIVGHSKGIQNIYGNKYLL